MDPQLAETNVLSSSTSLTLVTLPALIITQKSPENIFVEYVSLYFMAFALVVAKVANLFTIPYPARTTVNQATGTSTNSTSIGSSSDNNGDTHYRMVSRQTNRKH
ncbi:hypothetical protein GQX74_004969 [Glossina fuscipes]|nr:hypothetical protein GQX74_004969 [Glossina fuscipes]